MLVVDAGVLVLAIPMPSTKSPPPNKIWIKKTKHRRPMATRTNLNNQVHLQMQMNQFNRLNTPTDPVLLALDAQFHVVFPPAKMSTEMYHQPQEDEKELQDYDPDPLELACHEWDNL